MVQQSPVYQGQFGNFTIDKDDRLEVIIYRCGLAISAVSLCLGSGLILTQGLTPTVTTLVTLLFYLFIAGLGISLHTIHIYLKPLHNSLKIFWLVGLISSIVFHLQGNHNLVVYIDDHRWSLLGIGCVFASLTGIFIKEAFCFDRLEAKFLSFIVPFLLLGYMLEFVPLNVEQFLLTSWCLLFVVFIIRKSIQDIPSDIGDKSVFAYLQKKGNDSTSG